ncbi:MAG TPA: 16S rRNA (adenine(1518)-N(6)/adenine(1519)-N(6))-dimethyltransferase RsmA [Opitutales bacterium]|nr:16S rRNA (adenine(1518)-N(6)/adenine(1519)-N(6))-dimethyltransferase RsmA [Opitutales bacterium]
MPLTPTQTRALLAQLGVAPRRQLGQNFLVDGNLVRKSLELADVQPGDVVVEVGPGLGTLSEALLAAGAEVFAVEVDRQLEQNLRLTLAPKYPETFHLLEGDAVEHPRAGLPDTHPAVVKGTYKVVANLPYSICTPWLDALLGGPLPERLVLMLQREAAERFTATAGTAERGAISIFTEAAFARAATHTVSRKCFYPEPKVDSVLLGLTRKPNARAFRAATKKIIREFFTQRRKQLGALVRRAEIPALHRWLEKFPALGLDPRVRPEDVPLAAWVELDQLAGFD